MPRKKSDHPRSEHPFEKISGQSRKSKRRETAARTGANVRILIVLYICFIGSPFCKPKTMHKENIYYERILRIHIVSYLYRCYNKYKTFYKNSSGKLRTYLYKKQKVYG